jgi:diaminohydroxyphosphoribosylaminopyrimidine deaminase / 5-amino-6-(5-phosphoribosylamino)uracil reductase
VNAELMPEEAGKLIEPFACHITSGSPLVISKVGMSLDGKIGIGKREDRWITSPEGRGFGQRLRLVADAILVGIGTVLADDPELTYRGETPKNRPLMRVILDSELRTPPSARLFRTQPAGPVLIFCSDHAPDSRRRELESQGAETSSVPATGTALSLQSVLQELGKRNVLGLLVEGGSSIHWSFLSENLVDCFYFIIAPIVMGGSHSVPAVSGEGYTSIADSPRFKIRRSFSAGPDTVLETYPVYSRSIVSPWLSPESAPSRAQGFSPASKLK